MKEAVDMYGAVGAVIYHDLAETYTGEILELTRAVRATTGAILELAAGSGRLTFPLLALGRPVIALDRSADILAFLEQRLAAAPDAVRARCTAVLADMTTFQLTQRFGAVVLGAASISVLSAPERAALYRRVAGHLNPDGRFIVTTRGARPGHSAPEDATWFATGASGQRYTLHESWLDQRTRRVTIAVDGDRRGPAVTSVLHDLPPELVAAELTQAGLVVGERRLLPVGGDWDHGLLIAQVTA
jgi:SAM-dependent methyltransferase